MRLKKVLNFVICTMLICICLGKVQVVNAESVSLQPVMHYVENSKYDVTGDGVADTVKVKTVDNADEQHSGTIQIFVNDNVAFEQKREANPFWQVNLIRLANGKVFFDIESTIMSDDDCIHQLYVCENGKLKSVYDFQKYYDKYASYYSADIVKVSGNTIKTEVMAQFHTTGRVYYNMNVQYKDGKFERTSNTFSPKYKKMSMKNKWTAKKKIKVYKKAGSKKTVYTLKKGDVIKLNKIIYKNNKVYFQVKNNKGKGKTGYIPATKKNTGKSYFKESQFAG